MNGNAQCDVARLIWFCVFPRCIIHNEIGFKANEIQGVTNALSYMFAQPRIGREPENMQRADNVGAAEAAGLRSASLRVRMRACISGSVMDEGLYP